jgi:hypothetical protein
MAAINLSATKEKNIELFGADVDDLLKRRRRGRRLWCSFVHDLEQVHGQEI